MIRTLVLAAAMAAALPAVAGAAPQSKAPPDGACFNLIQMQGDVPINDHTVLFRVNVSDIYALDFANKCPELTYPDPKLILTPVGGMTYICHAIDLDVRVGENGEPRGFAVPCIPVCRGYARVRVGGEAVCVPGPFETACRLGPPALS